MINCFGEKREGRIGEGRRFILRERKENRGEVLRRMHGAGKRNRFLTRAEMRGSEL